MKKLYYLLIISFVFGCTSYNHSLSRVIRNREILLVKSLVDTVFQKEILLKRYLKFNGSDNTIYIKTDSILGIDKKWNKLIGREKHNIVTVDTTNKHYFKFLKLKIQKNTFEIEMISESTGNMIIGKAKLKGNIWDLKEISSGIR
jgi:hypothetical protein